MATGVERCARATGTAPRLLARLGLASGLGLFVGSRLAAIHATALNWDEFALLDRAARMAQTGVPETGGRPGLVEWLLLPLVSACRDEMATAQTARWLWLGLTLLLLGGLYAWLRELFRERPQRRHDALFGVALLALVPAFLEWSLQIRTDQLALVGGVWGGAWLLASQRRAPLAFAAGLAFGVGHLASQKLLYLAALAAVLAAARPWLEGDLRLRREALRAGLCLAGFGLVFGAFRAAMAAVFDVPASHPSQQVLTPSQVGRALDHFDFYRNTLGWSQYRAMLPTLGTHALMLAASALASALAWRRRSAGGATLALVWGVLLLGVGVALFHAGAFFYFWMTLGVFPAVALALALGPVRELLLPGQPRQRALAGAALWGMLLVPGALQALSLLSDTQRVQRQSLAFIRRNFEPADAGFHPERALFCSTSSLPLPLYFSQTIFRDFAGPDAEANRARMEQRFRSEQIKFLVQSFRLNQFPLELRRFWAANYQPYRDSVFVAGRRLEGARDATREFEVIVPGAYRWLPSDAARRVQIDTTLLGAGEVVALSAGTHTAGFLEDATGGLLVLALDEPPGDAPLPFYKVY